MFLGIAAGDWVLDGICRGGGGGIWVGFCDCGGMFPVVGVDEEDVTGGFSEGS